MCVRVRMHSACERDRVGEIEADIGIDKFDRTGKYIFHQREFPTFLV